MQDNTTDVLVVEPSSTHTVTYVQTDRPRRTTPEAGHALEKLGHAIDYLADELVEEGCTLSADNGRIQAIQILMALNRQVYFECPVVPTFGERLRSHILHLIGRSRRGRGWNRTFSTQMTHPKEHLR